MNINFNQKIKTKKEKILCAFKEQYQELFRKFKNESIALRKNDEIIENKSRNLAEIIINNSNWK